MRKKVDVMSQSPSQSVRQAAGAWRPHPRISRGMRRNLQPNLSNPTECVSLSRRNEANNTNVSSPPSARRLSKVVCGTIIWRNSVQKTSPLGCGQNSFTPHFMADGPTDVGMGSGGGGGGGGGGSAGDKAEASRRLAVAGGGGSNDGQTEQGAAASGPRSLRKPLDSRRDPRSSRRIAAGAGATNEDEESFNRHFALETPLQQVSGAKASVLLTTCCCRPGRQTSLQHMFVVTFAVLTLWHSDSGPVAYMGLQDGTPLYLPYRASRRPCLVRENSSGTQSL